MKISYDRKEIMEELLEDISLYGKDKICYLFKEEDVLTDYDIKMTLEDILDLDETRQGFNLVMALAEFILLDSITNITRSAAYLKAQRLVSGLTQKQIADVMGIIYQNVQQWESTRAEVSISIILKVSRILNFDVSEYIKFIDFGNDEQININ